MKRVITIFATLFIAITPVFGQDLDLKIHKLIGEKSILELRETIDALRLKYPENHALEYIDAMIEKDGNAAIEKYQNYIDKYPASKYLNDVKFRIAQFYFAKGLYRAAEKLLSGIENEGKTDLLEYWSIRIAIALNLDRKAEEQIDDFVREFPGSPYLDLVREEREQMQSSEGAGSVSSGGTNNPGVKNAISDGAYAIQIGAFLDRENALKQKDQMRGLGHDATIIPKQRDDRFFYMVRIGRFDTEDAAREFGESFQTRHGISYTIVSKEGE
ncbi:MAG: SPOR domain-containing protein [candidate division KSB1 bacterium]|jgi:hypothetical protein|nr:SPOR domain-containing protein [candidate division KSB1 bacterium]